VSGPDFTRLAPLYDELRPADDNWSEIFERLVTVGRLATGRVLDVGCGTGRVTAALAARGAKAWGVDPSAAMLEVARSRVPRGAGLREGRAEGLPFRDGWFDAAVCWLTVHLWDRPRGFAEVARVLRPGGRVAIATFDPTHFDAFWLNRLFPAMERIDRDRFPTPAALEGELAAAGLRPELERLSQTASITRRQALERIRGRHISTFQLIADDEYEAGLARAEHELPKRIVYTQEWLIAAGERV